MGGSGGSRIPSSNQRKLEERAKKNLRPTSGAGHVFISFAHEDEDSVKMLRGQAKDPNTDLEFDDFSLKDAIQSKNEDYIKREIRERIDHASVTAVYLSPAAYDSTWVEWEITESLKRGKGVIGIYKGDTPPAKLPVAFKKHSLKVVKWSHKNLMAAINEARKNR